MTDLTPYELIRLVRFAGGTEAPSGRSLPGPLRHLTHAVVRSRNGELPIRSEGWDVVALVDSHDLACAVADCAAALLPAQRAAGRTPGAWEVATIRDNPMGGEHAQAVHTGRPRELISRQEQDELHNLLADCRTVLDELVQRKTSIGELSVQASDLISQVDDLMPDKMPGSGYQDEEAAERRAFTRSEPESMPD